MRMVRRNKRGVEAGDGLKPTRQVLEQDIMLWRHAQHALDCYDVMSHIETPHVSFTKGQGRLSREAFHCRRLAGTCDNVRP